MDEFVKSLYAECGRNVSGCPHVLCIQDTTELNYDNIRGRIDAHGSESRGTGRLTLREDKRGKWNRCVVWKAVKTKRIIVVYYSFSEMICTFVG